MTMNDSLHGQRQLDMKPSELTLFFTRSVKGASIQPFDRRWSFLGATGRHTSIQRSLRDGRHWPTRTGESIYHTHLRDKDEHCIAKGQTVGGGVPDYDMAWHYRLLIPMMERKGKGRLQQEIEVFSHVPSEMERYIYTVFKIHENIDDISSMTTV